MTGDILQQVIQKNPNGLIARAYAFAKDAHKNQKRATGEPYFIHPVHVAQTLLKWGLDETTVAAGLLHDTIEDTQKTEEDIKRLFGDEICFLVNGVTKIGKIKYRDRQIAQVENLRKMILALSEDIRVIFIKLADRLHNMRTITAIAPAKQKRIAAETNEIYAPLAYRLGMHQVAGDLQDICFPILHPQEERWLKKILPVQYEARLTYLEKIRPLIEETLNKNNIYPEKIDFRAKRHSSLYKKLLSHNMDIEKIYDLVAMRIILKDTAACYATLGVIHQYWPPLPGRIKDYIAMPKPNGYRSLHTTVIGPEKQIVEVQIRDKQMHEENENGIAAHWLYKQKASLGHEKSRTDMTTLIQQLKKWQEHLETSTEDNQSISASETLHDMKIDFFRDRIFAITPQGDVVDLPAGSTPIDFAYRIHTDLGDTCVAAKVNSRFVPLETTLSSGDMVEILTQKNKKPSEDWLQFVKTPSAKEHIKNALRKKPTTLRQVTPPKVELKIIVQSRVGLLKDITGIIARSHINITDIRNDNAMVGNYNTIKCICDISEKTKAEKLMIKLKKLKEVKEISYRMVEK
jgi:GTP pyrophosphokinase